MKQYLLDKGIKNGFWHAWIVGAGSMIADGLFILMVYLGMVHFLRSSHHPNFPLVIWWIYLNLFRY